MFGKIIWFIQQQLYGSNHQIISTPTVGQQLKYPHDFCVRLRIKVVVEPGGRPVQGLWLPSCWECGFPIPSEVFCVSLSVSVLRWQVEVSATGRFLVQRSPTECVCYWVWWIVSSNSLSPKWIGSRGQIRKEWMWLVAGFELTFRHRASSI